MIQTNGEIYFKKYTTKEDCFFKKSTNKAKLINRQIKKAIKSSINKERVYVKGRILIENSTICSESCGALSSCECDECDEWVIDEIETVAIVDVYLQCNKKLCFLMVMCEANSEGEYYENIRVWVKNENHNGGEVLYDRKIEKLNDAIEDVVKYIKLLQVER